MTSPRKPMPILTIAGALVPAIFVGAAFILSKSTPGSGGWGLGEIFIFVVLLLAGAVLGAVCTVLAMVRGEPWRGVQAIVLMMNVCAAFFLSIPFFRARPVPPLPTGESVFLALAPGPERVSPKAILLAYPASTSPDAGNIHVIGQRDARNVVSNLRIADESEPLKQGELHMQLNAINARWAVRRDWDHIRDISDRGWRQGVYLEIRVTQQGWGIPAGVVDQNLRPLD